MSKTNITQKAIKRETPPNTTIAEENVSPLFASMYQGPGTNKISQIGTDSKKQKNQLTLFEQEGGFMTFTNESNDFSLRKEFKGYKSYLNETEDNDIINNDILKVVGGSGLSINARKLLDYFTVLFTQINTYNPENSDTIKTNISCLLVDYMKKCDMPITKDNTDNMRKTVKDALEELYRSSINWDEKSKGKAGKSFFNMRLISSKGIVDGVIFMGFSNEIARYLVSSYVMSFPLSLLQLDGRNSNAYNLGRKLTLHYCINKRKGYTTANIISVSALLKECPNISKYEDIENKYAKRLIITPFETALDNLLGKEENTDNGIGLLNEWRYCNSKGASLSDEQINNEPYHEWIERYIWFELREPPEIIAKSAKEIEETPKAKRKYKQKTQPATLPLS